MPIARGARADVIVLGTGGIGSAACARLAARGATVIGLDRFAIAHDRGSSHGQTRLIRQAYFEHPDYVPLLLEAQGATAAIARRLRLNLPVSPPSLAQWRVSAPRVRAAASRAAQRAQPQPLTDDRTDDENERAPALIRGRPHTSVISNEAFA